MGECIRTNVSLAPLTTFRVGGCADRFYAASSPEMLREVLRQHASRMPIQILGGGSNLLVRDGGLRGLTVSMRKFQRNLRRRGTNLLVGASTPLPRLARWAAGEGLGGLEFLAGIPGTLGGAIRMNAGTPARCMAHVVRRVWSLDLSGLPRVWESTDIHFSYRKTSLPPCVITAAELYTFPQTRKSGLWRLQQELKKREQSQPIGRPSAGSTFKNPPEGPKAAQLIEWSGLKGYSYGGAVISRKHANFMINDGRATAEDLETLGEIIQERVFQKFSVLLEWEVRRLGVKK